MFDINSLLDVEKEALECTYFDFVTVTRNKEILEGNITKNQREVVLTDEKCALSVKNSISAKVENDNQTTEMQGNYILFLSKKIQKGDKLIVTRENGEIIVGLAGLPSYHVTHYEVPLLIQERA